VDSTVVAMHITNPRSAAAPARFRMAALVVCDVGLGFAARNQPIQFERPGRQQ